MISIKILTLDHVNILVVDLPYSSSTKMYMYMYTVHSVVTNLTIGCIQV